MIGKRVHRVINPKFKIVDNKELIGKVGMIVHRVKVYDTNKEIIYEPYKNAQMTERKRSVVLITINLSSSRSLGMFAALIAYSTRCLTC